MSLRSKCLYVGEFSHTLDAKGRLTVPAKWRFAGDEEEVYLGLPNPIGCISVYPPKMVERLEAKIEAVSLGDRRGQRALTKLFAQADHFGCDKSGRIHINEKLRLHADIGKDVMLVGSFATFQIWNVARYEEYLKNGDTLKEDEMSQILTQLGV